jgi:hypothetical protein
VRTGKLGFGACGVAVLVLIAQSACKSKDSTDEATTAPAPATQAVGQTTTTASGLIAYENRSAGIRLQYPSEWTQKQDDDYVLALEPAVEAKPGDPHRRITVDVPSLPPHLPGMITLSRVKSGFIKGQKKKLMDVNVIEDVEQTIPNAKADRVVLTGKLNGEDRKMAALLMMHDDRVYIIRADSDLANYPQTKAAWDQMVASLQWTK